jgi:hypothetical protein
LAKKTVIFLETQMWLLQGGNVAKCSLTIMDVDICIVGQKNNENFGNVL